MPRGGKREGAGRRKLKPENLPALDRKIAGQVLDSLGNTKFDHKTDCECEVCRWRALIDAPDLRLRFDVHKYLTDRRDGKPVQTVNHLHDKPIEIAAPDGGPLRVMVEFVKPK